MITVRKYCSRPVLQKKASLYRVYDTRTCSLRSRQDQALLSFLGYLIDIDNVFPARKQVRDVHRSGRAWKIFKIERKGYQSEQTNPRTRATA